MTDAERDVMAEMAAYRDLRLRIEEAIQPLASSVDGRNVSFQASPHHLVFHVGGYVAVEHEDGTRLCQVVDLGLELVDGPAVGADHVTTTVLLRVVRGAAVVRHGSSEPFHDGLVRPATPEEVQAWLDEVRPGRTELEIGELHLARGVDARLDAGGFDRHTFLCGQSGSGKTYALGVILERLLSETSLRIVVLDPNSDFTRLGELRSGADDDLARRLAANADVVVRSAAERGDDRLSLRFAELEPRAQAAALRLDPIADREEYAQVLSLLEAAEDDTAASLPQLLAEGGDDAKALRLRLGNLGVDRWRIWSRDDAGSVVQAIAGRAARCLVVDLGSLPTLEEKAIAAEAVLATLWRQRADRVPTLVVIDEAHNVCPSRPPDAVTAIAAEHAVRIAAEGRKYGLYLLVSTQRPQKVDEQVVSQCDNLVLMRMNSRSDLAHLSEAFSFVPAPLLALASEFAQGEALVAGKIASHPMLTRFGARLTEEGGSDVPADWAEGR